jgi:glycosyltransferase involved in cell wall biosynthesis
MASADKKKILILTEWFLPGRKAGGPVKSIESLVWAMSAEFDFFILTTDTDLGEKEPYRGIETNKWIRMNDQCSVYYLPKKKLSAKLLAEAINTTPHDFLQLNSFYSKWFSIVPLKLKKASEIKSNIILAPRGMLSAGALALKPLKKKAFIFYSKLIGLHKNITWQATYPQEMKEIKNVFGEKAIVKLLPNFSKPVLSENKIPEKIPGELRLFYLSRIARVKNLHIALKTLSLIKDHKKIQYDIFGNIEDAEYLRECEEIISKLPARITVRFCGEADNNSLSSVIKNYHFLFLPTSNENFGHSIFESLQMGFPVIISNATPWKNLEEKKCGWDLSPLPGTLLPALQKALRMENEEFQSMSAAALKLAREKLNFSTNKKLAMELFN